MRVEQIWRYPVKSCGGEQLDAVSVGADGIVGDRCWGVRDRSTGLVLTARREPSLLFLTATHADGQRPIIVDADGRHLDDDAALSDYVGRPVELIAADDGAATFETPLDDDESDWATWQSAGRTFHDGRSTVSLVSRDTLGDWDHRRFRINLIVDDGGEDAMTDTVDVGAVRLRIRKPIERCVMVTRPQPGIERDLAVLQRVAADRGNRLGIGAVVEQPGTVVVGDPVTVPSPAG